MKSGFLVYLVNTSHESRVLLLYYNKNLVFVNKFSVCIEYHSDNFLSIFENFVFLYEARGTGTVPVLVLTIFLKAICLFFNIERGMNKS